MRSSKIESNRATSLKFFKRIDKLISDKFSICKTEICLKLEKVVLEGGNPDLCSNTRGLSIGSGQGSSSNSLINDSWSLSFSFSLSSLKIINGLFEVVFKNV